MRHIGRIAFLVGLGFMGFSSFACANDIMFSQAAAQVVGPTFLVWFALGLVIFLFRCRDFTFIGIGGFYAFLFCTFGIMGHTELALTLWMFYIGLLTVYYMFPRAGIDSRKRMLNLIFHGSFLGVVIVGGIAAKVLLWSHKGGFTAWAAWMREIAPMMLVIQGLLFIVMCVWLISRRAL